MHSFFFIIVNAEKRSNKLKVIDLNLLLYTYLFKKYVLYLLKIFNDKTVGKNLQLDTSKKRMSNSLVITVFSKKIN